MSAADTLRKCVVCQGTGRKEGSDYLDCSSPGCNAVDMRLALNGFMKSFHWTMSTEDRAWDIFQYAQKQFAAEAVLRDGEKQEPVGAFLRITDAYSETWLHQRGKPDPDAVDLFTHPAPSLQAVEAVPPDRESWFCAHCQTGVPSENVTFEQNHDPRAGGCGYQVGDWPAPQPPAAPSGDVVAAAKALLSVALDEARGRVHICDADNNDIKAKTLSEEMQALYYAITATKE